MTKQQQIFLASMTEDQATRLIAKFKSDPEAAAKKSEAAYSAFCQAWEMIYPGEYWQRVNMAGGTRYNLLGMA